MALQMTQPELVVMDTKPRRRRLVKKTVHFHGDIELTRVGNYLLAEYEASQENRFPGPDAYARLNAPRILAGYLPRKPGEPITPEHLRMLQVERTITVVADPDPHVCDWRCEGAFKGSECRCECRGRNHGRKFRCDPF